MTTQFKLEQRSTTEILSEIISETYKVTYSFNYSNGQKPKAISFNLCRVDAENDKILSGSYLAEIGQLDFKAIKPIEDLGTLVDHITESSNTIIEGFITEAE
ncbi:MULTISPECIES: hypothetical protein [unclassified Empedobacter]|uniref:hypothetical protein n=1 Tax=unclassified Empedobacter TaxID=2643773 RepID=UPI0025C4A4CB|nr:MULTISPECIES: hypothetical protein [unclassified Empedobacter]